MITSVASDLAASEAETGPETGAADCAFVAIATNIYAAAAPRQMSFCIRFYLKRLARFVRAVKPGQVLCARFSLSSLVAATS